MSTKYNIKDAPEKKEQLIKFHSEGIISAVKLAELIGVSDVSIRKWAKELNLTLSSREISYPTGDRAYKYFNLATENSYRYSIKDGTFIGWYDYATIIDPTYGEFIATPYSAMCGDSKHIGRLTEEKRCKNLRKFKDKLPDFLRIEDDTYITSNHLATFIDLDYEHINGGIFVAKPIKVSTRGQRHPEHGKMLARLDKTMPIEELKRKLPPHITIKNDVEYKNLNTKITLVDSQYGEFDIIPAWILNNGHLGHPERATAARKNRRIPYKQVAARVAAMHPTVKMLPDNYQGTHYTAKFVDSEYGPWEAKPYSVLLGVGHPERLKFTSKGELEILDFVNNATQFKADRARILPGLAGRKREIDVYVKELKWGLEYNGLYSHSDAQKDENSYHVKKRIDAESMGIRLLQILEDEWLLKKEIVKSIILNSLNKSPNRIGARKLNIIDITSEQAQIFLIQNHLMGEYKAAKYIGLVDEHNNIKSLFGYYMKDSGQEMEIARFCNLINHNIPGGFSRLLKEAINRESPKRVVSFVDLRYGTGKSLLSAGFICVNPGDKPGWAWTDCTNRFNRLQCRANMDERKLSEKEHAEELGWYKIYDAGQAKFVLKCK